jgi:hypothetical protein
MILTLHNLAQTYNVLPSQALSEASSFDLYVLDTHLRYVKYQQDVEDGKYSPQVRHNYSQEALKAMIERTRSGGGNKTN